MRKVEMNGFIVVVFWLGSELFFFFSTHGTKKTCQKWPFFPARVYQKERVDTVHPTPLFHETVEKERVCCPESSLSIVHNKNPTEKKSCRVCWIWWEERYLSTSLLSRPPVSQAASRSGWWWWCRCYRCIDVCAQGMQPPRKKAEEVKIDNRNPKTSRCQNTLLILGKVLGLEAVGCKLILAEVVVLLRLVVVQVAHALLTHQRAHTVTHSMKAGRSVDPVRLRHVDRSLG